ncbi:hypothetical protein HFP71_02405 [Streptomyces sp. ARC32]
MTTLAVEATVHHLDLTVGLPDAPGPSATGPGAVRATLDGLLGRPVPYDWATSSTRARPPAAPP